MEGKKIFVSWFALLQGFRLSGQAARNYRTGGKHSGGRINI